VALLPMLYSQYHQQVQNRSQTHRPCSLPLRRRLWLPRQPHHLGWNRRRRLHEFAPSMILRLHWIGDQRHHLRAPEAGAHLECEDQ